MTMYNVIQGACGRCSQPALVHPHSWLCRSCLHDDEATEVAAKLTPAQAHLLVAYSLGGSQPATARALIKLGLITPAVYVEHRIERYGVWGGRITDLGRAVAGRLTKEA